MNSFEKYFDSGREWLAAGTDKWFSVRVIKWIAMNIECYKNLIADPTALENSKFTYRAERWKNIDCRQLVSIFEEKAISRIDVVNAYAEYYKGHQTDWRRPILLTMIWGFADTGYGAHRTINYLAGDNEDFFVKALTAVQERNLKDAFLSLKKIHGLGISYLSKILYFATRAHWGENDRYALIFDIRVARGLVKLTAPDLHGILEVYPSSKFNDYQRYIDLIHQKAKENGLSAEALELFLFNYADDKAYPA